jgi:hypothetical protein
MKSLILKTLLVIFAVTATTALAWAQTIKYDTSKEACKETWNERLEQVVCAPDKDLPNTVPHGSPTGSDGKAVQGGAISAQPGCEKCAASQASVRNVKSTVNTSPVPGGANSTVKKPGQR